MEEKLWHDRNECQNYRGISLLSIAGKVYGKTVIERVQKITESRISEEQDREDLERVEDVWIRFFHSG